MTSNQPQGPRIIAFCGAARSGKDTAAAYFVAKGYTHLKIAAALKEMVGPLFQFTPAQLETDEKDRVDPRWGVTPRRVMQFFGEEVMQRQLPELLPGVGRQFWIRRLLSEMDPNTRYVISDLRYQHEYDLLKQLGAQVIRIERQSTAAADTAADAAPLHNSEKEFRHFPADYTVTNRSGVEALYEGLDWICRRWLAHIDLGRPL